MAWNEITIPTLSCLHCIADKHTREWFSGDSCVGQKNIVCDDSHGINIYISITPTKAKDTALHKSMMTMENEMGWGGSKAI